MDRTNNTRLNPHNILLDVTVRTGVVGLAGVFVVVFVIGFFQPIFSHVPEVIFCVLFSIITVLWRLNADGVQEAHQCSLDDSFLIKSDLCEIND